MPRAQLAAVLVAFLAACSAPQRLSIDAAPMVEPAPELRVLERFVGDWKGTSKIVSGDLAALGEAFATPDGGEPPSTFEGGARSRWVLSGMFVKTESWHATGTGEKIHFVDFKTWDAAAGKYRGWYFNDLGESGESTLTLDPDGSTFHVTATGTGPGGGLSTGGGSITFTDEDTMEWTWFEEAQGTKLELRGTNTRK